MVIHHHHYFPDMDPIGMTHQTCNIKTYTKGVPTPHIYVHNLTNYDSNFILKMIPNYIMAHKGKNTENQWSVIAPPGNKNKIKLLMTPFGTFSDSMNFFNNSLADMASGMSEEDLRELYELHYSYFTKHPRFKATMKKREKEKKPFTYDLFKLMFKGKLIFPYDSMNDLDWLMIDSDELPGIEEFMNNAMGSKDPTGEQYANMMKIYEYFECKNMPDLLHIYTLEDRMLLALIMSNTFERMSSAIGLDPTNFASTAKYSYMSCKRIMNMVMQTIPNARVFNAILQMKRAGFSMIKKQVSLASPFNDHIRECQYSPDCPKCGPFVRLIEDETELQEMRKETYRVLEECKQTLRENLDSLRKTHEEDEIETDTELMEAVEQIQQLYTTLKTQAFVDVEEATEEQLTELIVVLQSCIIYFDENNQYGYALKQILPIGNYVWLNYNKDGNEIKVETLEEILAEQTTKLRADKKARVVDFYTCVDVHLPEDCSKDNLQCEEEFNLLVRNQVPEVYNFPEKMLRAKRCEYKLKADKYKNISLYKKLMSGTAPLTKYWIHSSILKTSLLNGWRVTRVHNTLTFVAQRVCEEYIQFNQDMRLKYNNEGREFLGLFHKLMNNGFYGWFCRAVETYQETHLLFSGMDSYNHFKSQNDELCSGLVLQEQAVLTVQNPHDNDEQKKDKIINLFDSQVIKAENSIAEHRDFLKNCTSITVGQSRIKKIQHLQGYIGGVKDGKLKALRAYNLDVGAKELETLKKRADCERDNKRYYEIPKSRQPANKNLLKTRDEAISKALYGKQNMNTSVIIFNNNELKSVCFGLVTSPRRDVQMRTKNDVAVSVLAHAKSRIAEFVHKLNRCLPNRMGGVSIRLAMTDTDSAAYQVRYPVFLRRVKKTKKLVFPSTKVRKTTLQNLGADKMKEHIELLLSGSPEMSRIVDRAHFIKNKVYFDPSRKKKVGLYTDEIPLPSMIVSFQACGPKNYQFKKTTIDKEGKVTVENKVKHKGIPRKTKVTEEDYSSLILLWDRQYDANRSVMGYNPHDRADAFKEVRVEIVEEPVQSKKNLASKNPKMKKVKRLVNLRPNVSKLFTSNSFYTTQAGVFRTRMDKRLGATPSDKVLFPRAHFGSYSIGSRFGRRVREFNKNKKYDELFTDDHLQS